MSTAHIIAQLCMLATLILMITGKIPIYMTAIVGAAISALIAGFPMAGGTGMTVTKMIVSGLNPVIADMTGILLFIGIMQATGFLDVIIRDIVRLGNKWGGGVGVACAGGVAAGVIGALTGFTQPVITAVICGPAAVRLGGTSQPIGRYDCPRWPYWQLSGLHSPHAGCNFGDCRHWLRPLQCLGFYCCRFHLRALRNPCDG